MAQYRRIPEAIQVQVKRRDTECVYCGRIFNSNLKHEWEHIDNDPNNISIENIALCCGQCNRSKSNKKLSDWLRANTPYRKMFVGNATIADIIKAALNRNA